MSRDVVPAHLAKQLSALADPTCPDCDGDGFVTFRASNALGYTEVRCACCDRGEPIEDDDAWSGGFAENH